MGTELYKRNQFINVCFEELCVKSPELVLDIHLASLKAGADVLTTNSFGANRYKLADYLLAEKTGEIARGAAELARRAARSAVKDGLRPDEALVAGSVGPLGRHSAAGVLDDEAAVSAHRETMEALMDGGADFIIMETFGRGRELSWAVRAARELGVPYLPCMAFSDGPFSLGGETINEFFACCMPEEPAGGSASRIAGSDSRPLMLGFNCSLGPKQMLEFVSPFIPTSPLPVLMMPNAGAPQRVSDRTLYLTSPEYFGSYARRFVEAGVRAVGGCCGTGPEHIAEAVRLLKAGEKGSLVIEGLQFESGGIVRNSEVKPERTPPRPLAERSQWGRKLAEGSFVTSVEIVPPMGYELSKTIDKARRCAEAGVDAINIPDGPRASSRVSPMVTAMRIQADAGLEAVLHVTCRDRNIIGVQSDLLGCAAAGIHNLLIVTGDPPKLGDYPFATAVFDLDSIGLTRAAAGLNGGLDIAGKRVEPSTFFVLGVGADPTILDQEREIARFEQKALAGAEFAITQPVYDAGALLNYIERVKGTGVRIIAGIWPPGVLQQRSFHEQRGAGSHHPGTHHGADAEGLGQGRGPTSRHRYSPGAAGNCPALHRRGTGQRPAG